jgi:hypothetical protein
MTQQLRMKSLKRNGGSELATTPLPEPHASGVTPAYAMPGL